MEELQQSRRHVDVYQFKKIVGIFDPIVQEDIRQELLSLIGEQFEFKYAWLMGEDEMFPGYWALTTQDDRCPYWIPEFDIMVV